MIKFHHYILLIFFLSLLISSCKALQESSKNGFTEGFYKSRIFHKEVRKVYVVPDDDQMKVYTVNGSHKIDTLTSLNFTFHPDKSQKKLNEYLFRNGSPDIYIFSTVLKYRPALSGFPNQLNTSIFNGAFYLGYRNDFYKLKYTETPLHEIKKNIRHYGFSLGAFAGLGTTAMNEFVTQSNINIEYDGFVNIEGVSAFLSVRKLNFGVTAGIEHLMDSNRKFWIYQGKSWIGLSIGLNLN